MNNFLYHKAWASVRLANVQKSGRKVIGLKWMFKIKPKWTGVYNVKCRIINLGYLQELGLNITEKFDLLANSTSTRLIILFHYVMQTWDMGM